MDFLLNFENTKSGHPIETLKAEFDFELFVYCTVLKKIVFCLKLI
jgi:hypothetical protein